MEQIDFYILPNDNPLPFTCRLLEKAYKQNHQIYVCANSKTQAEQLNDMLWTFNDISFVPHHLISENGHQSSPIVIGFEEQAPVHDDIYVTLSDELPDTAEKFERVIFIVPNIEEHKQIARKNYKELTDKGYNVQIHKM